MTTAKGGSYGSTSVSEEMLASATVTVDYVAVGAASAPLTETRAAPSVAISLTPNGFNAAVPGSVMFDWMGTRYSDNGQGVIFRDVGGVGVQSGVMDYSTCTAILSDWTVGPNPASITLVRLWTQRQQWTTGVIYGRTSVSPVKPAGMTLTATDLTGEAITGVVDQFGDVIGTHVVGSVDVSTGTYQMMFGDLVLDSALTASEKSEWWYTPAEVGEVEVGKVWRPRPVDPTSLRYNAVTYTYLPIDADLMGITPERLPTDGRMPWIRPGMFCVIGNTITGPAFVPTAGTTYNVGETLLSSIDVLDEAGTGAVATGYTEDLDAGTITINDTAGWPAEVYVRGRAEVMRRVASASIGGAVRLTMPVGRDFPADSVLSTALMFGNRQAYVERMFDQYAWNKTTWLNYLQGDQAPASYNATGYPVEVNNRGTVTERFALYYKDGTNFDCYGEHLGLIGSGNINEDFAPANRQADDAPYLVIRALGHGGGWLAGNTQFIHTVGAEMSYGLMRSTNPGSPTGLNYDLVTEIRGDKDRPPSNPFE